MTIAAATKIENTISCLMVIGYVRATGLSEYPARTSVRHSLLEMLDRVRLGSRVRDRQHVYGLSPRPSIRIRFGHAAQGQALVLDPLVFLGRKRPALDAAIVDFVVFAIADCAFG
jgi:hypothetical protein